MADAKDNSDRAGMEGRFELQRRPAGSNDESDWETFHEEKNLIPDAGLNHYRDMIDGRHQDSINRFVYGTGTTDEAAGDTELENEVLRKQFGGSTDVGTGQIRYTGELTSIEPSGQPYDISEVGVLFEDGTLASRITFPAETKDQSQEWRVRYTLTIANA